MAFGVFITRPDSSYSDTVEQYQFPAQYLGRARACEQDWIIYYEPVKLSATRGYFAVAKVDRVVPDPSAPGMHLALIAPGTYLEFARGVPFTDQGGPNERGLLNAAGRISGRAQSAVRPLAASDFNRIVALGLEEPVPILPRVDVIVSAYGVAEATLAFDHGPVDRLRALSSRVVRDRVFRSAVLRVYDGRCAVTGLKLINGGGRAEAEAAHIKSVAAGGPDVVANGIALSGTAHWMFDRGLIGFDDDMRILVSRHVNSLDIRSMIRPEGHAMIPALASERPHPKYLAWHRDNCFKH